MIHPSISTAIGTDLVERLRAGDARALEELFRQQYVPLCRFAERYLRDVPVDSRDVRLVVERAVEQRVRVVDRLGAQLAGAYVGITDGDGSVPSMAPSDREGRISVTGPGTSTFDLMAFANRRFDPEADFFDALFLDEDGKWIDEMTGTARGLGIYVGG